MVLATEDFHVDNIVFLLLLDLRYHECDTTPNVIYKEETIFLAYPVMLFKDNGFRFIPVLKNHNQVVIGDKYCRNYDSEMADVNFAVPRNKVMCITIRLEKPIRNC